MAGKDVELYFTFRGALALAVVLLAGLVLGLAIGYLVGVAAR